MSIVDPRGLNEHFNDLFRQGQLDSMTALYEPNAVIRLPDGSEITGHEQIKGYIGQLLTLRGELVASTPTCTRQGDLALLTAEWSFQGRDAEDRPVKLEGRSSKVARQDTDGIWRYVIDA
ncbi:YybH family protein [Caldimonas brevitalea]|uniref:SnoaL-like domain-containing protein n=1 Tax=Caldimonas brevitalea TaxID=413882 RepID=A0A0G3BKU7_9BURK|nr:nuclear transport factor 2 family protein [Caldimonas brevitalea]AKJ30079.1 hypothetical protein AAW51_3388 [Caldimonas brevitalea]